VKIGQFGEPFRSYGRVAGLVALLCLTLTGCLTFSQEQTPQAGIKSACSRYKLTPLPLKPAAINDSGVVAGTSEAYRAALWSSRKGLQEIPLPAGYTRSAAVGLNRRGVLLGLATNIKENQRAAFTFVHGKVTMLPGSQSRAYAINDDGAIAGEAILQGHATNAAVLWKHGTGIDVTNTCCGGVAVSVNNRLQVVGNVYNAEGHYEAFLWEEKHGFERIGAPGSFSSALAINNAGHVLIESFSQGILFYQDGKLTPLTLSTKFPNHPRGLTDSDVVIGSFGPFADADRAFRWDSQHGLCDLNDGIPSGTHWKLRAASGINRKGEIVGWGDYKGEEGVGFLLTPE